MGCRLKRDGQSEGLMRNGRGVFLLALILVFPLPPANDMHELVEQKMGEVVLVSHDGWTSDEWGELVNSGQYPLHQLSFEEMLVWAPIDEDYLPENRVQYRGELWGHESYRIILEPRLPSQAEKDIIETLYSGAFNPTSAYLSADYSPLSSIVTISPSEPIENLWQSIQYIHGIRWVEPVLETSGRNDVASAIMQSGNMTTQPAWNFGLDGSGVIVANADSGIDRDHACFRDATEPGASGSEWNNATGTPGNSHRKIIFLNESIDQWDSPADENYRHGTHIAGSLVCRSVWESSAENNGDWVNATPSEGTSIAFGARLVVEDVVDGDGWHIPKIGDLFWDAGGNGAVIRSDSWGDDTTEYTSRTERFDTWLYQVPWSVSFVAPGNTGAEILEPANGLNVVSVGVSAKDGTDDLWTLSPREETQQGRMGVTLVVPGESIVSAKADGIHDSYNENMRSSTGTSMAAPQAAAAAAVIQQMVEQGWITGNESREFVNSKELRPDWIQYGGNNVSNGSLMLSNGFTPSGTLIRAIMVLSTDSLEGGRQVELELGPAPDNQQGWGRLNLSNLVDFDYLENNIDGNVLEPANNIWIHDSFRLKEENWQNILQSWVTNDPMDSVSQHQWKGEGASGPFIKTGEEFIWELPLKEGEDFDARLVWNSAPDISLRDDLDLQITLPNGSIFLGNDFDNTGERETIETIEGVHISASNLIGIEYLTLTVKGEFINIGPKKDVIGLNGDKIGFSLAVKGVDREGVSSQTNWEVNKWEEQQTSTQDNDSKGLWFGVAILLAILLILLSIVGFDEDYNEENYSSNKTDECEPSNHEGFSLPTAVAVLTGDDDE